MLEGRTLYPVVSVVAVLIAADVAAQGPSTVPDAERAGPDSARPPSGGTEIPDPSAVPEPPGGAATPSSVPGDIPPPPPPPPAPSAGYYYGQGQPGVRLRVTSETPGLELNLRMGSVTIGSPYPYYGRATMVESYRSLCAAPCETSLLPGTYSLMIRDARGRAHAVREHTSISQPSELAIGLHRPRGAWIAGSVLVITGVALAAVGVSQVSKYDILDESSRWNTYFGLGFAGLGLAGVGGMILAFSRTRGVVEVRPFGLVPR